MMSRGGLLNQRLGSSVICVAFCALLATFPLGTVQAVTTVVMSMGLPVPVYPGADANFTFVLRPLGLTIRVDKVELRADWMNGSQSNDVAEILATGQLHIWAFGIHVPEIIAPGFYHNITATAHAEVANATGQGWLPLQPFVMTVPFLVEPAPIRLSYNYEIREPSMAYSGNQTSIVLRIKNLLSVIIKVDRVKLSTDWNDSVETTDVPKAIEPLMLYSWDFGLTIPPAIVGNRTLIFTAWMALPNGTAGWHEYGPQEMSFPLLVEMQQATTVALPTLTQLVTTSAQPESTTMVAAPQTQIAIQVETSGSVLQNVYYLVATIGGIIGIALVIAKYRPKRKRKRKKSFPKTHR
jgi:hypothetical protein